MAAGDSTDSRLAFKNAQHSFQSCRHPWVAQLGTPPRGDWGAQGAERQDAAASGVALAACFPEDGGFSLSFPRRLTWKISDSLVCFLNYLAQPSRVRDTLTPGGGYSGGRLQPSRRASGSGGVGGGARAWPWSRWSRRHHPLEVTAECCA